MFLGYCRMPALAGGGWTPAMHLDSPEAAIQYANLQKRIFPEVRIVDEGDCMVLQAVNGKITFPQEVADLIEGPAAVGATEEGSRY